MATVFTCAGIPTVTRENHRIVSVGLLTTPPGSAGYQALLYEAADHFAFDTNGFGGTVFRPEDKRPPSSPTHDLYVHVYAGPSPSELQLWSEATAARISFATVGLLAEDYDGGSLCFFAAGKPPSDVPGSNGFEYIGEADGISQTGGSNLRLQGSTAKITIDYAARNGQVTLNLIGRPDPFGNFAASAPVDIGTVTGMVTLTGGTISGSLAGANGMTGVVRGTVFNQLAQGAGLVFELRDPASRLTIGAVAADIRGI